MYDMNVFGLSVLSAGCRGVSEACRFKTARKRKARVRATMYPGTCKSLYSITKYLVYIDLPVQADFRISSQVDVPEQILSK